MSLLEMLTYVIRNGEIVYDAVHACVYVCASVCVCTDEVIINDKKVCHHIFVFSFKMYIYTTILCHQR